MKATMSYKILIVDDSKLARMAVIKALNALYPDWTRLEAANADEALKSMKEDNPGHRAAGLQYARAQTASIWPPSFASRSHACRSR